MHKLRAEYHRIKRLPPYHFLLRYTPVICIKGGAPGYKVMGRSRIHDSILIINTINLYRHVYVLCLFNLTLLLPGLDILEAYHRASYPVRGTHFPPSATDLPISLSAIISYSAKTSRFAFNVSSYLYPISCIDSYRVT